MKQARAHKTPKNGGIAYRVCVPKDLRATHKCGRKFFTGANAKQQAEAFAKLLNEGRQSWSSRLLALSHDEQGRLLRCLDIAGSIEKLERSLDNYKRHVEIVDCKLCDAIDLFIRERANVGHSRPYENELARLLRDFLITRETLLVSQVVATEINDWINNHGWGQTTRRGAHTRLHTFFSWCAKRKYCAENPVAGVMKPKASKAPKGIFTPPQVEQLLAAAVSVDPGVVPFLAVGLFAGVRPSEIARLTPDDFSACEINVTKTKTGHPRVVTIRPVLAEWLKLYPWTGQPVNLPARIAKVRKACPGLNWPHDGMRHSFCSYVFADLGLSKAAAQAGNTERVFKGHYQALVPKVGVEAYWNLTPANVLKA